MSTYCVTFRIANETVDGKTYEDRRKSVVNAVYTKGKGYWDETTSFFIVNSELSTGDFAKRASSGLSSTKDMLVAFDPSDMSMAYFGAVRHTDVVASFFKSSKKVA